MKQRIILIPKDDLIYYPPTISLINVFLDLNIEVVCLGEYSDTDRKSKLEQAGVKFVPIYRKIKDVSNIRVLNWLFVIIRMKIYQRRIKRYLQSGEVCNDDLIWFIYSNSVGYIQKYIEKFDYIIQFYEFENFALNGKSKFLHPSYDVHRLLTRAKALIHCEYNRAVITNGLYGINKRFYILPNKPYDSNNVELAPIPGDVNEIIEVTKGKVTGKKVILYQGIFNPAERRLDDFCEAMSLLPDDYVFIAMGGGGGYYEEMKKKYSSDRIIFIPFIRPPFHLEITKLASFGVLTYHPANYSYVGVINPLYCAPNKIFEFGKFGIPMISNDVPGLKMIFSEYNCGKTVSFPLTPQKIADTILTMEQSYQEMSKGARAYYDSVDFKKTVLEIIE